MPFFTVTVTETNERQAIVDAPTKEEAIKITEEVWNDSEQGYDVFMDMQDCGHFTECNGLASKEDLNYLPKIKASL